MKKARGLPDFPGPSLSWKPSSICAVMEKPSAQCRRDSWGNLLMTIPGEADLPPVYTGFHLDSVPHGGKYDGALGITVPLAIAAAWHEKGFRPCRPLTIIAFAEEEGTRFGTPCLGSQAIAGKLQGKDPDSFETAEGRTLSQLLREAGLEGDPFAPHLLPGKCFLELHIEQGRALEDAKLPLGIVSAIGDPPLTGDHHRHGQPCRHHSYERPEGCFGGSSPVDFTVFEKALASQRQYVATVGHIRVFPDAGNVVPGKAELSLEIRSASDQTMDEALAGFQDELREIARSFHVTFQWKQLDQIPPLPMEQSLMDLFEQEAQDLKIPYQIQPSWAGHDSMILGHELPTAMLFVPSVKGISHSPEEYTEPGPIGQAAEVLERALQKLTAK